MNDTLLTIKEYIDKLPPNFRKEVVSFGWQTKINEIGQKYSLKEDEQNMLFYETMFVMIGMEPEEEFANNIEKEVGISNLLANQLKTEIEERIFKPLAKKLSPQTEKMNVEETQDIDRIFINLNDQNSTANINLPKNLPTSEPNDSWFEELVKKPKYETNQDDNETGTKQSKPIENTNQNQIKAEPLMPEVQKPKLNNFGNFIDHKLNQNIKTEPEPQKTYIKNNDPYREPIE